MYLRSVALASLTIALLSAPAHAGLDKLHKQAIEGGRLCMIDHNHFISSGTWPTEAQARATAAKRWESFTRAEYGRAWGSLSVAAGVKWSCKAGKSHRGATVSCDLAARPCKH